MIDLLGGRLRGGGVLGLPLNPEAAEFAQVPRGWIPEHGSKAEEKEARRKLRRHFRKMGFGRLGRPRFDVLSLSLQAPTPADLLRPAT